jgi:hypothetical protein
MELVFRKGKDRIQWLITLQKVCWWANWWIQKIRRGKSIAKIK